MPEVAVSEKEKISVGRVIRAIGPAIVVASVVLGPGSILINSKVGATFGYGMIWVLGLSTVMMIFTVILAAVIGVSYPATPLTELRQRLGKPFAIVSGFAMFSITTGFQFTNNLAVMAVVEQVFEGLGWSVTVAALVASIVIVIVNTALVMVLYGSDRPYKMIEKIMMAMVGMMLVGFLVNLLYVNPSLSEVFNGMVPRIVQSDSSLDYMLVLGLIGTTFSFAGAFYQAYAVREKGWTEGNVSSGVVDAVVGIGVLGMISLMIMVTSASALRGVELRSLTDVSQQLQPLLGPQASIMFGIGILAGACSSLLVNALIGGTVFSDGLGFESRVRDPWPKGLTVGCLAFGMVTAIAMTWTTLSKVTLIVTAQAMTVIGLPMIAIGMFVLAWNLRSSRFKPLYCSVAIVTVLLTGVFATQVVWTLVDRAFG